MPKWPAPWSWTLWPAKLWEINDCCLSHSANCIGYNNPNTWRQKFLSIFRLLCYFPLTLPLARDTGIRTTHIQPWDAGPGVRRTRLESYLRLFLATCLWAVSWALWTVSWAVKRHNTAVRIKWGSRAESIWQIVQGSPNIEAIHTALTHLRLCFGKLPRHQWCWLQLPFGPIRIS